MHGHLPSARPGTRAPSPHRGGFTLVESLIALVVGTLVLLATFGVLSMQARVYRVQGEMDEIHATLQQAGHVLVWELREVAAGDGDVVSITDSTITVRSKTMSSTVCRKEPGSTYEVSVFRQAGPAPAAGDSILLFLPGDTGPDDDSWGVYQIQGLVTGSPDDCAYDTNVPADMAVRFQMNPADTAELAVGSPLMAFQHATYGAYTEDGRRWLGRRVGGTWERYAGPLADDPSVRFTYRGVDGSTTTIPADVASIEILLNGTDDAGTRQDSVRLKVWPRG